jgi:HEAT repeat protein
MVEEDNMVNNPVVSGILNVTGCADGFSYSDIPSLVKFLGDADGFIRLQARKSLICIGKPAAPALINTLSEADPQIRWQAIKVLEGIGDPDTAPALVHCLQDENAGVRWAASEAMIALQKAAIPTLLEALLHDYDSLWLRQGAHHILHRLKDNGKLNEAEVKVFEALEDVEPTATVPWAAEKALEAHGKKNNPH